MKQIFMVALAYLVLFGLCACSSSGAGSAAEAIPTTEASTEPEASPTPEASTEPEASPAPLDATPRDGIWVRFIGNSCFYIVFPDGTRLVSDPYGSSMNSEFGPLPLMEADIVTVSHSHEDHIGGSVKGEPQIIKWDRLNEKITVGSVEITGYSEKHVANMCDNAVFIYQYGGLKIVNVAEAEDIKSEETLKAMKDADLVLMYAGEYSSVKNDVRFKLAQDLNIKVIIPEHYSMDPDHPWYNHATINQILDVVPQGMKVVQADDLVLSKDTGAQFIVLSPLCKN